MNRDLDRLAAEAGIVREYTTLTGETVRVESPLPDDIEALLAALRDDAAAAAR